MAPTTKTVARSNGLLGREIVKERPISTGHFLYIDVVVVALSQCSDDDITVNIF